MAKSRNPTAFGSMDDIRKVFNKFDKNGDGKISCSEVVDNLSELGTKISPAEVELIMQEFDKDGDGYIDLDEFVDFIQNGGLGDSGGNNSKELRDAFDLYDTNKNGLISVDELHSVMKMLGLKCSLSDCRKMIREVDEDGDGVVFKTIRIIKNISSLLTVSSISMIKAKIRSTKEG
ncbi:calcium-binding protein CML23 [Populus alba x Populus x berolinensis]|nr:calcium-binding protein CML23 [Populus alba x Populus x berolinensis]